MEQNEGTAPETKKETRGRKKTERHIRSVNLYIHDDIICGGNIHPVDSPEYLKCLDKMQGILTRYCYENQHLFKTNF